MIRVGSLRFGKRHRERLAAIAHAERKRRLRWEAIDQMFCGLRGDNKRRAAIAESRIGLRPPRGYVCPPWMQPTISPYEKVLP